MRRQNNTCEISCLENSLNSQEFVNEPLSQNGAMDYVRNVMAPISVTAVVHNEEDSLQDVSNVTYNTTETPCKARKRQLSDISFINDNSSKKFKCQEKSAFPEVVSPQLTDTTDRQGTQTQDLHSLVLRLTNDVRVLNESVNQRMLTFEKFLEARLGAEINKVVDERVDSKLGQFKSEVKKDIDTLSEKVDTMTSRMSMVNTKSAGVNREMNIVIRNLTEKQGENLMSKVNGLIKDGLKISDVKVSSVERKKSKHERKCGVVIARCKSMEDKSKVMRAKRVLRDSRNFKDIFIENDIPISERILNENIKTIVNTFGNDKLVYRENRIVRQSPSGRSNDNSELDRNSSGRQYTGHGQSRDPSAHRNVNRHTSRNESPRSSESSRYRHAR